MLRLAIASVVSVFVLLASLAPAADDPPPQALKYHSVLVKRPSPGYLFDRFFHAWLDHASADELEEFLVAQSNDPGRPADGLLLAFFYAKQGDDLKAIEQFRATLATDPGNAAAWYEKAVLEARTLDFETALGDLDQASKADPNAELTVRIAKLRGKLLIRTRQREKALEAFRKLVADHPDDDELAEDVVELQIDEGLYDEATASAKQLIEKTSDPYRKVLRQLRLGDIRQRAGKRSEAIGIYSKVLNDVGAESWLEREILAQIERAFRKEDDITGLNKQYEKLLETYPRRVGIRRGHARVLADAGEHDKAVDEFREILKITPGDRGNQEAFIALLVRVEDYPAAQKQLEALIEQHSDDAELYVQLAELAAKTKTPKQATMAVDKFLAKSDKGEYDYLRAARLLERIELPDAAKEMYAALTDAFPKSPSAKEARAAFLYKTGEKDKAIDLWHESASSGEAAQSIRVAKALSARQEHQAAYDLLTKHLDKANGDSLFLAQLANVAMALKKFDEAIPLVRQRVDLATTNSDLDDAIAQAAKAIERSDLVAVSIKELQDEATTTQRKCLLSELYEHSGHIQLADETLAPLVEAGDALAITQQIRLARLRRDWNAAIKAMRRLIDSPDGRKSRNVRQLVEFYDRAFQIDKALEWIPEWKKLSPGSTSPWLTESRLQQIDGKDELAIETLRIALREFDDASDIRSRLAMLYTQAGKLPDAERIYWRDYEESDDISEKLRAVEQLARVAEQQGKTGKLVERFEERRRENRESIEPLMALAAIHRVANNYEQRLQALGEAAKMRPDDIPLLKQIARIQEQEGDWELARNTLERAAEIDANDSSRQQLARLHLRWGNAEEGYKILYDLLRKDASDPRAIESIAEAMISNGDWERSEEFLTPYVEQWPDDYRLRYLLAVAQEEIGDELVPAAENFIAVMRNDVELPTVTTNPNAGTSVSYYQQMAKIGPPGLEDLLETVQHGYTVYRHRQQRRGYASMSAAGAGSPVSMPANVEAAHRYALLHIATLLPLLEEEPAELIRDAALRSGVPAADVVLAAERQGNSWQLDPASIVKAFPDNDAVLGYAALMGSNTQLETETYQRAFERLSENWPQLAVLTFTKGAMVDEELHDQCDRAVQLLAEIEDPSSVAVMQFCTAPLQHQARTGGNALPDKFAKALRKRLIEWYPKVRDTKPYGQYIFSYMASMLAQEEDLAGMVQLLDDEVARSRSDMTGGAQASPFVRQQQQRFLTTPSFPPTQLQRFPASVLSVLSNNQGVRNPFTGEGTSTDWDKEAVVELLPTVDDPTLRLLLAHTVEADEIVSASIDELMDDDTPTLDDFLLAASWATEQEQPGKAAELLDKARYLPMDRNTRRNVDAQLVALVLDQLDASTETTSEETKQVLATGRAAALRLRHAVLQADQRLQLADALEELGLEKEAERLAQATSARPARPRAVYASPSRASVPADSIQRLIEAGKQDAAARLMAAEVTSMVRQVAGQPLHRSHSSYQFRQLKQRLDKYGLRELALEQIDPGETTSHRKVAEYAMALAALDKPVRAAAVFARALEMRPKEDSYRVQLIAAKAANGDFDNVSEHFDHFGRNGAGMLAMEILTNFQDHQCPIERRLGLAEVGIQLLQHQREQPRADLSWVPAVRNAIANQQHTSGRSIASLYALDESSSESNAKHVARRRELHDTLCREMVEADQLAEDGFAGLLASHEAAGDVDETFAELAFDVVERAAKPLPNAANQYQNFVVHYSNSTREVPLRTPGEFLVRHAWENDRWSVIDDDVLPSLRARGRNDLARAAEDFQSLYQCSPEEFPEKAKQFVRRKGQQTAMRRYSAGPVTKVCEIWHARDLDVDLEPILLGFMRENVRSGRMSSAPPYVLTYMEHLVDNSNEEAACEWLEHIAEVYIGPKEKRADSISKHYTRNSWSSNSPNGAMHMLGNLLEQALSRPKLLDATLLFIAEGDVAPIVPNARYHIRSALQSTMSGEADEIVAFLSRTRLLGQIDQLRIDPVEGVVENVDLFNGVIDRLKEQRQTSAGKEVAKQLAELDEQTVGVLMIRCILTSNADLRAQLLSKLGEGVSDIQSWDAPKQRAFARQLALVIQRSGGHVDQLKPIDEPAVRAVDWLRKQLSEKNKSLVDTIAKAKRYQELNVEGHQLDEWLAKLLPTIAASDPQAAATTYLRVTELYDQAMSNNSVNMYYSRSTTAELLPRVASHMDANSPQRAMVMIAVLEGPGGEKVALGRGETRRFLQPVTRKFGTFRKKAEEDGTGALGATKAMYQWLSETFGDQASPLMSTAYTDELWNYEVAELEKVEQWLAEQVAADERRIAADMLAATRFDRARKTQLAAEENRKPKPTGRLKRAEHHEYYEALLLNDENSLAVRLTLADFLYDVEKLRLPLSSAHALATVGAAACNGELPLSARHERILAANAMGLQGDDAAREYLDAWMKRFVQKKPATNASNYPRSPNEAYDTSALLSMLRLCYDQDRSDDAKKLVKRYGDRIGARHETIALLVEAGAIAEAVSLARRNWRQFPLDTFSNTTAEYNERLDENLTGVLQKLSDPSLVYIVEAAVKRLPNSSSADADVIGTPDSRLVDVARRFEETEWKSTVARQQALTMLRSSREALKVTRKPLAEIVSKIHLESLADAHAPEFGAAGQLVVDHALQTAREGDPQPLVRLLKRLVNPTAQNEWRLQSMYRHQGNGAFNAIIESVREGDKYDDNDLRKLAEGFKFLAVEGNQYHNNNFYKVNLINVVSHLYIGDAEAYLDWVSKLEKRDKGILRNAGSDASQWKMAVANMQIGDDGTLQQRIDSVANLINMSDATGWIDLTAKGEAEFRSQRDPVSFAPFEGVFADEEATNAMFAVAEQAPAGGATWAAVAKTLEEAGENEKAADAWDKATKSLPEDQQQAAFELLARQILALHAAKLDKKAMELLPEMAQRKKSAPDGQKRYDEVAGTLEGNGQSDRPKEEANEVQLDEAPNVQETNVETAAATAG